MQALPGSALPRVTALLAAGTLAIAAGLTGGGATEIPTASTVSYAGHARSKADQPQKRTPKAALGKASAWTPSIGTKADPARWDRCTPIVWKVDFTALVRQHAKTAPELARWRKTFAAIARETGYPFRYGGTGTYQIRNQAAQRGAGDVADIAISYGTYNDKHGYREQSFAGHYGVWGIGGSSATGDNPVLGGGSADRQGDGSVIINAIATALEQNPRTREKRTKTDLILSLYLHEMGHAMNLNHVTDRLQMMYPSVQSQVPARYGAGDKAGLRNMGHRACFAPETTDPPATDEPDGPDYPTDGRADGICTIFAGDPDCAPVPDGICQVGDPTCYDGACNAADPADPDCSDVPVGEARPAPSLDAVSHYPPR